MSGGIKVNTNLYNNTNLLILTGVKKITLVEGSKEHSQESSKAGWSKTKHEKLMALASHDSVSWEPANPDRISQGTQSSHPLRRVRPWRLFSDGSRVYSMYLTRLYFQVILCFVVVA